MLISRSTSNPRSFSHARNAGASIGDSRHPVSVFFGNFDDDRWVTLACLVASNRWYFRHTRTKLHRKGPSWGEKAAFNLLARAAVAFRNCSWRSANPGALHSSTVHRNCTRAPGRAHTRGNSPIDQFSHWTIVGQLDGRKRKIRFSWIAGWTLPAGSGTVRICLRHPRSRPHVSAENIDGFFFENCDSAGRIGRGHACGAETGRTGKHTASRLDSRYQIQ